MTQLYACPRCHKVTPRLLTVTYCYCFDEYESEMCDECHEGLVAESRTQRVGGVLDLAWGVEVISERGELASAVQP